MPGVGIEPTSLARHDFKSCAYTSSAIRAKYKCEDGCGHKYFARRRLQNFATPPRLFFLLKKYICGSHIRKQANKFACFLAWRRRADVRRRIKVLQTFALLSWLLRHYLLRSSLSEIISDLSACRPLAFY